MSQTPGPTSGLQIGNAVFPSLTAQPFGYEESNTRRGLTAKRWQISGLLKPSEWLALLAVYDTWRDAKIQEPDSSESLDKGTTVLFSGNGPGGQVWTDVECWFVSAPSATQQGAYLSVSTEIVDADEAIEVAAVEQEDSDELTFGTITFGNAVVTLTSPPDTREGGPGAELTATGTTLITGSFRAHKVKEVQGYISTGTYANLLTWYDNIIRTNPNPGVLFPVEPPTATAESVIEQGAKVTRFNVQLKLLEVL